MRTIICITGMPGSGKSSVASILSRKGFGAVSVSKRVKEMMRRQGIRVNTKSLRDFSLRLKGRRGNHIMAVEIEDQVKRKGGNVAIDSVRNMEEVHYIRNNTKGARVFLIAVTATRAERYRRMIARRRSDDIRNRNEFLSREAKEARLGVGRAILEADFIIGNTGKMDDLRSSVAEVLKLIRKGHGINK